MDGVVRTLFICKFAIVLFQELDPVATDVDAKRPEPAPQLANQTEPVHMIPFNLLYVESKLELVLRVQPPLPSMKVVYATTLL